MTCSNSPLAASRKRRLLSQTPESSQQIQIRGPWSRIARHVIIKKKGEIGIFYLPLDILIQANTASPSSSNFFYVFKGFVKNITEKFKEVFFFFFFFFPACSQKNSRKSYQCSSLYALQYIIGEKDQEWWLCRLLLSYASSPAHRYVLAKARFHPTQSRFLVNFFRMWVKGGMVYWSINWRGAQSTTYILHI